MARSSFATVAVVTVGVMCTTWSSEALRVVSPSEGMAVIAERPFEVEWTGAPEDARFDIDLQYCGSYSFCFEATSVLQGDCGAHVASLCPEGDAGCAAEDGGYEVVMPEPIVPGDGYRLRVSQVGADNVRCSDSFHLLGPDGDNMGTGASISVVSPTSKSVALAGEEYMVEFEYDNGLGSSVGRFMIDLYESEGSGDCGSWKTSICDKPDRGCRSSAGDYNVVIPTPTASGTYRIRVGLFGDESVYACSEAFEIISLGSAPWPRG